MIINITSRDSLRTWLNNDDVVINMQGEVKLGNIFMFSLLFVITHLLHFGVSHDGSFHKGMFIVVEEKQTFSSS